MNKLETVTRASGQAIELAGLGIKQQIEVHLGSEKTRLLYPLVYKRYMIDLNMNDPHLIQQTKRLVISTADYWFSVDAHLDNDLPENEVLPEADSYRNLKSTIYSLDVAPSLVNEVEVLVDTYREQAFQAHTEFEKNFHFDNTKFDEVVRYRENTTGAMAEMITFLIGAIGQTPITKQLEVARTAKKEVLAFQAIDDGVDCISDILARKPNLFASLLHENFWENQAVEQALKDRSILASYRPLEIVKKLSKSTYARYEDYLFTLLSTLPIARQELSKNMWALSHFISHTPHAASKEISIAKIFKKQTFV